MFEENCQQRYSELSFSTCMVLSTLTMSLEEMVYLNALGQPMLVIHGLKAAAELLDRCAHIYSSRPRMIMAHEIITGGLLPPFLPYGAQYAGSFPLRSRVTDRLVCRWRRN